MDFIQKKSRDQAVDSLLPQALEQEIDLTWDRFEGQLPECGFCEAGLSCRDCLQGPCISHPFRDSSKKGVCGKDRDLLAAHSLLRLVLKGVTSALDQLSEFTAGVESGILPCRQQEAVEQLFIEIAGVQKSGLAAFTEKLPKPLTDTWQSLGISPQGVARDIFRAGQKLEGGLAGSGEILLWAVKAALLGLMANNLQGRLKRAVFGDPGPSEVPINLGLLSPDRPALLLAGPVSPVLKALILERALKKNISVFGICGDPLQPPYTIPTLGTYLSQEAALLTGAVDLVLAAEQFVNPSLKEIAGRTNTFLILADELQGIQRPLDLVGKVLDQTSLAHEARTGLMRNIPGETSSGMMGYRPSDLNPEEMVKALQEDRIKGLVILAGSNNVKYTQDETVAAMANYLLANDVLCLSTGEAGPALAKYGYLSPDNKEVEMGRALVRFRKALANNLPPVIDLGAAENGGAVELFLALAEHNGSKALADLPLAVVFSEAGRSVEAAQALSFTALGVETWFWPCLPVTGGPGTVDLLSGYFRKIFGAGLNVVTDKLSPASKAELIYKSLTREFKSKTGGKDWS